MKKIVLAGIAVLSCFVIAGCGISSQQEDTSDPADSSSTEASLFPVSSECSACHDGLTDSTGEDYSFVEAWQGSVHAAASVDPYYLATVRHETLLIPSAAEQIQSTCATCHLPMAHVTAVSEGESTDFLDNAAQEGDDLHSLYADGISCMACHQIVPESVSDPTTSNSGRFLINTSDTREDLLYGTHELTDEMQTIMENSIGYTAEKADIYADSAYCATCHTLYTGTMDEDGTPTGTMFPEQTPYIEWQQSSYPDAGATCQSCHMPDTAQAAKIALTSTEAYAPMPVHTFVGGNAYLLSLLDEDGTFDEAQERGVEYATEYLKSDTGTVDISTTLESGTLTVVANVTNSTGHKLPTAFPSRRAWLHVIVTDASGAVVFESGAWDTATGQIVGNANDDDPTTFEPHYDTISDGNQVQIYESILGDVDGAVTTAVMHAETYLKDNRLLPSGFDKASALPDTAVIGDALADSNFVDGSDTVTYAVPVSASQGQLTVTVELAYQSMGYRWLQNLNEIETAEQAVLAASVADNPNIPVIVASEVTTVNR